MISCFLVKLLLSRLISSWGASLLSVRHLAAKVSEAKTKIFFSRNVHASRTQEMSRVVGFSITGNLGRYLGVPSFTSVKPALLTNTWWSVFVHGWHPGRSIPFPLQEGSPSSNLLLLPFLLIPCSQPCSLRGYVRKLKVSCGILFGGQRSRIGSGILYLGRRFASLSSLVAWV